MPAMIDLTPMDLWFRVYHEEFSDDRVYKALALIDYAETGWKQLVFVNERGMVYAVMVYKTRCVDPESFSRIATGYEQDLPQPKARQRNSCIEELDK